MGIVSKFKKEIVELTSDDQTVRFIVKGFA